MPRLRKLLPRLLQTKLPELSEREHRWAVRERLHRVRECKADRTETAQQAARRVWEDMVLST